MVPQNSKPHNAALIGTTQEGPTIFPLSEGHSWRIGRSDDNEVVLKSHVISRCHAMVQRTAESTYYLIDMGSRNGSFVNHTRVSVPVAIQDGDVIAIGDHTLQFRSDPAISPAREADLRSPDATTITLFAWSRITVMVIDIRDYTGLTRRVEESTLCQVIGTWFRNGGDILRARGSWGQKYIGDAMMSIWVHKEGRERDEMRNVLAALIDLIQMTVALQAQFGLSESIRIGAGLNTGYGTVGNAGSDHLTDHTALGDTVNAAFRFESASKDSGFDVIAGSDTLKALGGVCLASTVFHPLTVSLKGYDQPWSVWGAEIADLLALIR
jgi:adenylate cyclase